MFGKRKRIPANWAFIAISLSKQKWSPCCKYLIFQHFEYYRVGIEAGTHVTSGLNLEYMQPLRQWKSRTYEVNSTMYFNFTTQVVKCFCISSNPHIVLHYHPRERVISSCLSNSKRLEKNGPNNVNQWN